MRRLKAILASALLVAVPSLLVRGATPSLEGRVVQILVTFQESNPFLPWQKLPSGTRAGYGVVIDSGLVLTTESLLRNATLVELRRATQGEKIQASVQVIDPEVNLALVQVAPKALPEHGSPLRIAGAVSRNDRVDILQFDDTGQIQKGEGRVLQIAMDDLPRAPYASLAFTLLTDLNANGEGAPAFRDGALAGLVIAYDASTRVATMIPYPMIDAFLAIATQTNYPGFASAGFFWSELVDPVKRAYLGVKAPGQGVLILSCIPGSGAASTLRANDVILEWDGQPIDNLGFYTDADFGRLSLSYLVKGRRKPGDTAKVRIVRDHAEQTLDLLLTRRDPTQALIPEDILGENAPYLVEGGWVIRELTGRYLRAHGANWERLVDPRLVHLYSTRAERPTAPGERVVILSGVLPDRINIGYQHFRNQIITEANGHSVSNMADIFRILDHDASIRTLRLQSVGVDLVLDTNDLAEANQRLADRYRLPSRIFPLPSAR